MKKLLLCVVFVIVGLSTLKSQEKQAEVHGVIVDTSGMAIADCAVYIPFTSIWTTSDKNGHYRIKVPKESDYELEFKHLSYKPISKKIHIGSEKRIEKNIVLDTDQYIISEVVKTAVSTNWKIGFNLFQQYVLSDEYGRSCKVINPECLSFYIDGDRLIGSAKEPLEIMNNYLGYRIIYYLNYFWIEKGRLLPDDTVDQVTFSFSGSAIYIDRLNNSWIQKNGWKNNRHREYVGTKRHFLQSLWASSYKEYGYVIRQCWSEFAEFQQSQKLSPAVAYAKFHEMYKVYSFNQERGESEYLHFFQFYDYPIQNSIHGLGTDTLYITISESNILLVFQPWNPLKIDKSKIAVFEIVMDDPILPYRVRLDQTGKLQMENCRLKWDYLDSFTNLLNALPNDYWEEIEK
ncbi:MAG: carboxypeptidase-like regulatory domain-containing protein [Bacteroidota bacterium]|nr:carboxypeptidase-like regulatory domain-containing protein [Bacteroidota bacterium]